MGSKTAKERIKQKIKSVDSEYRDLGIRTMGIQYKSFQLRSKDKVVGYRDFESELGEYNTRLFSSDL